MSQAALTIYRYHSPLFSLKTGMIVSLKWALAAILFCCSAICQENGPNINDKKLTEMMDSMNKRIQGLMSNLNRIENHKSQGSESEKVNILWAQNYRRNQYALKEKKDNQNIFCRDNYERRLFYTAVTRAKKFLDIYYLN